jgi:uncharacterized protein
MADGLDLATFQRAMRMYAEALRDHRDELDSLNVYPVPDGDTGTNLLLTQTAVVRALDSNGRGSSAAEVREAVSNASLMGARGNSGVILSQVLRGLVEAMREDGTYGPVEVCAGLRRAADQAYRAVARPKEGTVLSVLRDAAAGAATAGNSSEAEVSAVLAAALDDARGSLAMTRDRLPELREAGVVDAGGKGIVLLLDALLAAVRGARPSEPVGPLGPVGRSSGDRLAPDLTFPYEVQFLLDASDDAVASLRSQLAGLGDSLVVVGGSGVFNVHVHTDRPDVAVEAGRRAGRVREVRVDSLADRVAECVAGQARAVQVAEGTCAMVVVAAGDGLVGIFRSLGADVVRADPSDPAAVSGIVSAVDSAPAHTVFIIPNAAHAAPAIGDAIAHASKDVVVVAADSIPAGLAAATAFNPIGSRRDNATAMGEAAERVRSAALATVATNDAVDVVTGLLGESPELITVVAGAAATDDDRAAVVEALERSFPDLEVHAVDGGQPGPPFLIGVE